MVNELTNQQERGLWPFSFRIDVCFKVKFCFGSKCFHDNAVYFFNFQDDRHLALPSYIFVVDLSEKNYEVELPCSASHVRIHERHGKKSFDSVINLTWPMERNRGNNGLAYSRKTFLGYFDWSNYTAWFIWSCFVKVNVESHDQATVIQSTSISFWIYFCTVFLEFAGQDYTGCQRLKSFHRGALITRRFILL